MIVERWASIALGLVLPAVALLVGMPLLANTSVHVLGIPLLFAYTFALFPFTTFCLWLAWQIDRPHYAEDAGLAPQDGGEEATS